MFSHFLPIFFSCRARPIPAHTTCTSCHSPGNLMYFMAFTPLTIFYIATSVVRGCVRPSHGPHAAARTTMGETVKVRFRCRQHSCQMLLIGLCYTVSEHTLSLPGYHFVSVCPGGLEAPCGNNGNCNDGVLGKGTCQCHDGFRGTACELCANQHYGPNCTGSPSYWKLSKCTHVSFTNVWSVKSIT